MALCMDVDMIRQIHARTIYICAAILHVILLGLYVFAVWQIASEMREKIVLLIFGTLFLLVELATILFVRWKLTSFTDDLNDYLDEMIQKKDKMFSIQYDETLFARLQGKLLRLYEIYSQYASRNADEKLKMQSLVSDMSHQVKSPIANIRMYNDIMRDRPMTRQQQQDFLQTIGAQIDKLEFLMDSMIKMSRLETGVLQIKPKLTCIYDTIALTLGRIKPKAEQKNIEISVSCDPQNMVIYDGKWTEEALFNILDNAVKYTTENDTIMINVERWEFYTKIDITDNGKGIPESNHAAIFKRFYREEDVQDQEGVGIGLYLAREIITMQHGYIKVESKLGNGSTFSVFIPN